MTTLRLKRKWWPALFGALTFFWSGYIFIPYAGLQNDEVLPVSPLYQSVESVFHPILFGHAVPIMLLSYLGALKTWLYYPIFRAVRPSYVSIRVPALLLGAVTVGLVWLLLARIHSRRAAWIGMALLATDSMWVLTTCFDWGPVALQHLLGVAGMGLVVIFHRTGRIKPAVGAAFCFGLGLWDKALFAWLLGGLAVGAIAVFSREIWFHMRQPGAWKVAPAAVLAFGLGCSPLLVYNAANQWPTLHATSGFSTQDLYPKLFVLLGTWEGIALFGYIPHAEDNEHAKAPRTLVENVSFGLRHLAGEHRRNGLDWAVLSVVLLLPVLLWRPPSRRAVLFCLIAITIAWLQMGITKGAGGAAHHVVLLYPLPQILIAVVFAEMSLRWGAAGKWLFGLGTLCLAGMNLLVTNQYLYDFVRYGSAGSWSDAIYPLASGLKSARATEIAIIDWGITNPLEVLDRGRLPLFWAAEPFLPGAPGQIPSRPDSRLLDDPGVLWLAHTDGNEQFEGVNAKLDAFARRDGWVKAPATLYYDRNGRAIFQTFHLRRGVPIAGIHMDEKKQPGAKEF